MTKKQKQELTWIGKENRPWLEPRILIEDLEKSYHAQKRVTDHDRFGRPGFWAVSGLLNKLYSVLGSLTLTTLPHCCCTRS